MCSIQKASLTFSAPQMVFRHEIITDAQTVSWQYRRSIFTASLYLAFFSTKLYILWQIKESFTVSRLGISSGLQKAEEEDKWVEEGGGPRHTAPPALPPTAQSLF